MLHLVEDHSPTIAACSSARRRRRAGSCASSSPAVHRTRSGSLP